MQTPRGGAWHPQLVKRIVERLDEVNQNDAAKSGSGRCPRTNNDSSGRG